MQFRQNENMGVHHTSISIPYQRWLLMKKWHISTKEAVMIGSQVILGQKGEEGFDNPYLYKDRVVKLQKKLAETTEELENLKQELEEEDGQST